MTFAAMAGYLSVGTSRVIWFFLLVIFTSVSAMFSWSTYRAMTSKHWPSTDGVVIAFYETPNYRYSVDGKSHVSDYASCNELVNRYVAINNSAKYAVRYPLDAKVMVHYCPSNPGLAVLETTFDNSILIWVAVLLAITLLCATGFYRGWRFRIRSAWRGKG